MLLTLEEVKTHCRIDADYHNDDDDLYSLIAVAEDNIAQRLRYGSMEEAFPADWLILQSILRKRLLWRMMEWSAVSADAAALYVLQSGL